MVYLIRIIQTKEDEKMKDEEIKKRKTKQQKEHSEEEEPACRMPESECTINIYTLGESENFLRKIRGY